MRLLNPFSIAAALIACCKAQAVCPDCALSCASQSWGCEAGDYVCACSSPATDDGLSCVESSCSTSDTENFFEWAEGLCNAYGLNYLTSDNPATAGSSGTPSSPSSTLATVVSISASPSSSSGPLFTPTQAGSPAGVTTSARGASPTATASSSSTTTQPSSSINPGIIAGPVAGGVALIAACAIAFWCIRKRRSASAQSVSYDHGVPYHNAHETDVAGGLVTTGMGSPHVTLDKSPEVTYREAN